MIARSQFRIFVIAALLLIGGNTQAQEVVAHAYSAADRQSDMPISKAVAIKDSCNAQWGRARMEALAKTGLDIEKDLQREVAGRAACATKLSAWNGLPLARSEQDWLRIEIQRQYFVRDEAASLLSALRKKRLEREQSEEGQRLRQRQIDREREEAEKVLQEATGRDERSDVQRQPEQRRAKVARPTKETPRKEPRVRRESSFVQCCDGTHSPTCTYVHRGCCSHHGGVCE